jgi:hypothetical protein
MNLSRKVLRRRNDDAAEEASTFALMSGQHFVDRAPIKSGNAAKSSISNSPESVVPVVPTRRWPRGCGQRFAIARPNA